MKTSILPLPTVSKLLAALCFCSVGIFLSGCGLQKDEVEIVKQEKKSDSNFTKPESPKSEPFMKDVDAQAAGKLIAKQRPPVVIDVRTPGEFAAGHLEGAVNIDFTGAGFREELEKLDRNQDYLVHCQSGGRSGQSKVVFTDLGFKAIYHLDGGFLAWEEAELPTTK